MILTAQAACKFIRFKGPPTVAFGHPLYSGFLLYGQRQDTLKQRMIRKYDERWTWIKDCVVIILKFLAYVCSAAGSWGFAVCRGGARPCNEVRAGLHHHSGKVNSFQDVALGFAAGWWWRASLRLGDRLRDKDTRAKQHHVIMQMERDPFSEGSAFGFGGGGQA